MHEFLDTYNLPKLIEEDTNNQQINNKQQDGNGN
jgi:hypothetical protein